MSTLDEKIASLTAKLAAETDPAKYASLAIRLETLQAAKAETDKDDDEDDEEDDEDEKKAKKASGKDKYEEKKAEEKKEEKKSSKKSEEKKEEEDDEESKKAKSALSLVELHTGLRGDAAIGAAAALFGLATQAVKDVRELKAQSAAQRKQSLIASVKRHVPKAQLEWLHGQTLAVVEGFVTTALKGAPMVLTEESELETPDAKVTAGDIESTLTPAQRQMVAQAVESFPGDAKAKETFRTNMLERIAKQPAAKEPGRY